MTTNPTEPTLLFSGRFLNLTKRGSWEYVERRNTSGVVVVLPITDDQEIILVEQLRVPVGKQVIELPAGLAGDIPGSEHEALGEAAKRELLEETGYEAATLTYLTEGPSSAGLTSELISFFKATGLRKLSDGGGDASEDIKVHVIPMAEIDEWLVAKSKEGCLVDYKVYAAMYFLLQ